MSLSREEQETVALFNAGEKRATVYTADPVVARRLLKKQGWRLVSEKKNPNVWEFEAPKNLVRFGGMRPEMSQEKRDELRRRMVEFQKQKQEKKNGN